jgi:hypothetical protein
MREPRDQRLDSRKDLGGVRNDDCSVGHASQLAETSWKVETGEATLL